MPFLNIVKQVLRGNETVEHNLGTNIPKEKYCSYSGSHLNVVFWWGGVVFLVSLLLMSREETKL